MTMRRIRKTISKVCEQCHGTYTVLAYKLKQKFCSHTCATTNISQRRPLYAERIHVKKAERLPDPNQQQVDAAVQQFLEKGGEIQRLDAQGNLSLLDPDEVEDLDSIIQVVKSTRRDWLTHQL
tara:strand:+ start:528 stop:896 length:369 start_codon:yes stop_codon:yes gene_type:complete